MIAELQHSDVSGDRVAFVGVCRVCALDESIRDDRKQTTLSDGDEPVHLCCSRLPAGSTSCSPCRSAQAAEDDWQTRGKRRSAARAKQAALIVAAGATKNG